jgi:hypothetical protein
MIELIIDGIPGRLHSKTFKETLSLPGGKELVEQINKDIQELSDLAVITDVSFNEDLLHIRNLETKGHIVVPLSTSTIDDSFEETVIY